jgi:hypothetical protein
MPTGKHKIVTMKKNLLTLSEFSRRGGKARAKKLTAEQRSAIAQKAAAIRWRKQRDSKKEGE